VSENARPASEGAGSGQGHEEFVEPTRDEIPAISRQHVAGMESSDADQVWEIAGMWHVLVHTVGRKSGRLHKVALPYWQDPEGHRVVVGSFSGAPSHPAWYLNLTDRTANPQVLIREQGRLYWADAQILEGEEYQRTWAGLTADRAYYNDYQSRTDRRLPLVRFVYQRDATPDEVPSSS
jgi:deazaflavin-dependent oxidoreductase (nitroreductase family)